MALSSEDKKDVKGAMGKAMANKVAKVTKDNSFTRSMEANKKAHAAIGDKDGQAHVRGKAENAAFHAKSKALSKKTGLASGATGTVDYKAAERRIKKTGSVL